MDPRENIRRQREVAAEIQDVSNAIADRGSADFDDLRELERLANDLAELVLALDEWRTRGGYDPYMKESRDWVRR